MTTSDQDRELAVTLIRGTAVAAGVTASASSDPFISAAATGTQAVLMLVARLVESVGRQKAEEVLRELLADPARELTDAELDANVRRVKDELGL